MVLGRSSEETLSSGPFLGEGDRPRLCRAPHIWCFTRAGIWMLQCLHKHMEGTAFLGVTSPQTAWGDARRTAAAACCTARPGAACKRPAQEGPPARGITPFPSPAGDSAGDTRLLHLVAAGQRLQSPWRGPLWSLNCRHSSGVSFSHLSDPSSGAKGVGREGKDGMRSRFCCCF